MKRLFSHTPHSATEEVDGEGERGTKLRIEEGAQSLRTYVVLASPHFFLGLWLLFFLAAKVTKLRRKRRCACLPLILVVSHTEFIFHSNLRILINKGDETGE